MPKVSKRGENAPASPIRKLVPFAEAAKKRGVTVYHLNIGQPDILTPEIGMKAVREADIKVLEYSHSAGIESYRRKLADFYGIQHYLLLVKLLFQQPQQLLIVAQQL
jgi:aspartate aminotransferase